MAQIGSILGLVELLLHIIEIMNIKKKVLSLDRNFNLWVLLLQVIIMETVNGVTATIKKMILTFSFTILSALFPDHFLTRQTPLISTNIDSRVVGGLLQGIVTYVAC